MVLTYTYISTHQNRIKHRIKNIAVDFLGNDAHVNI